MWVFLTPTFAKHYCTISSINGNQASRLLPTTAIRRSFKVRGGGGASQFISGSNQIVSDPRRFSAAL